MAKKGTKGVSINSVNGAVNGVAINAYEWSESTALSSGTLRIEQLSTGIQPLEDQDSGYSVFLGIEAGSSIDTGTGYGTTCIGSWAGPNRAFYGQNVLGLTSDDAEWDTSAWKGVYTGYYDTIIGSGSAMGLHDDPNDASYKSSNVVVGNSTLYYTKHAKRNVVIGNTAAVYADRTIDSTIVGTYAFNQGSVDNGKEFSKVASFGYNNGSGVTEGSNVLLLGNELWSTRIGGDNPQDLVVIGLQDRIDFRADVNGVTVGDEAPVTVFDFVISNYAALDFADDTAASTGGVALGGVYHTAGVVKIRLT